MPRYSERAFDPFRRIVRVVEFLRGTPSEHYKTRTGLIQTLDSYNKQTYLNGKVQEGLLQTDSRQTHVVGCLTDTKATRWSQLINRKSFELHNIRRSMKYTYVLRPPELLKILQSLLRRLLSSLELFHGFGHTFLPFLGSRPYIHRKK